MDILLSAIVEIVLEQLLKTALKKRTLFFNRKQQWIRPRWHRASVQQADFVNHTAEIQAIQNALNESHTTRFLYFYGPGGIGKTRLIEEVKQIVQNSSRKKRPYWGGLYDLYHVDLHSILELQDAIANSLDPDKYFFQEYANLREQYQQRQQQGRGNLPTLQDRLNALFIQNLYDFSRQQYRLVIAFDTLETLAFESELIQSICKIKSTPVAVRSWLLQTLRNLENAVVLLAGRPNPDLQQELESIGQEQAGLVESIAVQPLTRTDSREMLRELLKGVPSEVADRLLEQSDKLWQAMQGSPVMLTLVVELLTQANQLEIFDPNISSLNFGRDLIEILFNYDDPAGRTFFFLALARQGLTPALLHYLEPTWEKEECEVRLAEAAKLGLVKTRTGCDELFLHDALYELFDQYMPPRNQLQSWYQRIADYYHANLAQANNRQAWAQAITKLFYYELQLNPKTAFEKYYMRWDETALRGFEIGLDMQLRNEILRFIHSPLNQAYLEETGLSPTDVERDSALRWIKRYLVQSQYATAIEISETIIEFSPNQYTETSSRVSEPQELLPEKKRQVQSLFKREDPFFWGQLLSLYGEALVYVGELNANTQSILENAAKLLHRLPFHADSPLSWVQERSLGRVYDRLGYLLRSNGRYGKALTFYKQALSHYENADIKDEQANTLNNLSFVQANLGLVDQAYQQVNRALTMRQQLGQKHPIALSLNTRGRIQILRGQIELGIRDCQTALNMFEEIHSTRGKGLAYNALGWGYRQKGNNTLRQRMDVENAIPVFEQAIRYLEKAISIFSEEVDEPIRLWEAQNELGSIYRDWGDMVRILNPKESKQKYSQAQEHYDLSLKVAQEHNLCFQLADTYDDLAQIAVNQGHTQIAAYWLEQIKTLIPSEHCTSLAKTHSNLEQGDAYWLILAKTNWQKAVQHTLLASQDNLTKQEKKQTIQTSIEYFALAVVHFQKYWPNTSLVKVRHKRMMSLCAALPVPKNTIKIKLDEIAEHYHCDLGFLSE